MRSCRDNRSFCYTAATRTIETNRIIVGSLFRSSASDKMRLSLTSIPKVYCNDRDTQKNWTEEKSTNSSRRPQKMAIEFLNSPFSKNPDGVPVIFSGFSTVRFYCSFVIRFVTRGTSQRPWNELSRAEPTEQQQQRKNKTKEGDSLVVILWYPCTGGDLLSYPAIRSGTSQGLGWIWPFTFFWKSSI